jgi:hypothetical protein
LWALGSIALGTNLFYYTFFQPAMSHVYSFGLASLLVYVGDDFFHQKQIRFSRIPLIAALLGLMVLIRPTNVVYVFYFLLLAVFKKRLGSLLTRESIKWLLIGAVIVVLIWLPQVYYWYYISGNYFIWSYLNESFIYLKDPKIWKVLVGAWNGWILYSPIVLLPLGRLFYGAIKNKHGELAVLLTLLAATYLFASWWAWWFGGAFGHRCYVDFLPLLVLPMTQLLIQPTTKWIYLLLLLLMYYNVGLTYQYIDSAPWDGPNWGYEQVWKVVKKLVGLE